MTLKHKQLIGHLLLDTLFNPVQSKKIIFNVNKPICHCLTDIMVTERITSYQGERMDLRSEFRAIGVCALSKQAFLSLCFLVHYCGYL